MASPEDVSGYPELIAMDRFEWERVIRRVQMPSGPKYLALMLSTYAEGDGTRVRPGVDRLVLVMGVSKATVKRSLSTLREMGLIERTKQGNRHANQADEYRLTVPTTMLDHPMLTPDETLDSTAHG